MVAEYTRINKKKAQDAGEGGILALKGSHIGRGRGRLVINHNMFICPISRSLQLLVNPVRVVKSRGQKRRNPGGLIPAGVSVVFPGRHLFLFQPSGCVWKAQLTLLMPA